MSLFQPAESTSAYLKMGLLGFAGSGKSYTASLVGRDLVQHMKKLNISYANKPVMFLDTETGSDWVKPMFEKASVPLYTAKTRAFADLLLAVPEAEANASVLIIDSITHFWKELCESYQKQKKRTRLEFQDWAYLKAEWGKFTDLYVNSNVHIILCGRAGFEYDYFEDDSGKKQLEKTGVKMKAEGEMGFEPSLLVLMERQQRIEHGGVEAVWRSAMVLKDRSTLLDGKDFVNPTFTHFLPHIERLNLGGRQLGVDTTRGTQHAADLNRKDWSSTQRKICLDEIQTLLVEHHPSTSAADKQAKIALVRKHFGNEEMTWTKVEEVMPLVDLRMAYDSMYRELKGKPSQYAAILNPEATTHEMDDELPGDLGPTPQPANDTKPLDEQELLARLEGCEDMPAYIAWSMVVAQHPKLTEEERGRLAKAGMVKQTALAKPAKPKADLAAVDPNTGAPAFLTREPKAEKTSPAKAKTKAAEPQGEAAYTDLVAAE